MVGLQDNINPEPKSTKYKNIHLSRSNSSLEFKDHLRASKKTTSPLFTKKDLFGGSHENNSIQSDKHTLSYHQHSFNMIRDQFENPNKSISNSNSNPNQSSNKSEISSPKLKLKFNRFWNHNNVKQQSMSSADESLSSTLMSTSITSVNNNSNPTQTQTQNQGHNHSYMLNGHSNTTAVSTSADMEERQRRRAFCHYDCQSLTANLSYAAKLRGVLLARRRNTTTGSFF